MLSSRTSDPPTAIVVGAGLAGLACAIGLGRAGWQVTVYERGDGTEVGAGFALSRNGVAAAGALGLDRGRLESIGHPTWAAGTWDLHGREILRLPESERVRTATALIGLHRRRLHGLLAERARAAGAVIEPGVRVVAVEPGVPGGARARVRHGGGADRADLVVGADGVRSALRASLQPAARAVYSGYSSWRAIIGVGVGAGELRQYWGPHAEFGRMGVGEAETYWYGYVRMPERLRLADEKAAAEARFAGWAEPVRELIAATDPGAVLRHDVHQLPGGAPTYVIGRTVLVGDAAHAMLPTMGQGVATALEDAACLGIVVGTPVAAGADLAAALARFDAVRRPRNRSIARAALWSGRIGAHLGGGARQRLRNALLGLVPPSTTAGGADAVMGWTPPSTST